MCCRTNLFVRVGIVLVAFLLIFLTCSLGHLHAQQNQQSTEAKTDSSSDDIEIVPVKMELELDTAGQAKYRAMADLKGIKANTKYKFEIELFNPFDEDVTFEEMTMSCACTQLTFERKAFPARATTKGSLVYHAPRFTNQGKLRFSLSARNNFGKDGLVATLGFKGFLRGVIDSRQSMFLFEVEKELLDYSFPVFITEPVTADKLDVKLHDLPNVYAKIEPVKSGQINVVFQIPNRLLPETGITGEAELIYKPTGDKKRVVVTFSPRRPIALHPKFLQFRTPTDKESDFCTASAILRIQNDTEAAESEDAKPDRKKTSTPTVECSIGDQTVEVELQPMSAKIFRLKLKMKRPIESDEADKADDEHARMTIVYDDQTFEYQLPFIIQE